MRKEKSDLLLNKYYFEPDLKYALDKSFRHSNNLMVIDNLVEKENKDLAYILEMDNYTLELLSEVFSGDLIHKTNRINIYKNENSQTEFNEIINHSKPRVLIIFSAEIAKKLTTEYDFIEINRFNDSFMRFIKIEKYYYSLYYFAPKFNIHNKDALNYYMNTVIYDGLFTSQINYLISKGINVEMPIDAAKDKLVIENLKQDKFIHSFSLLKPLSDIMENRAEIEKPNNKIAFMRYYLYSYFTRESFEYDWNRIMLGIHGESSTMEGCSKKDTMEYYEECKYNMFFV